MTSNLLFDLLLSIIGFALVVIGILLQTENFRKKYIKWGNEMKGVKTQITSTTMRWTQLQGLFLILGGLVFLFMGIFGGILPALYP